MSGKQVLRGWFGLFALATLMVAMSWAQEKPIGKPRFIVRSGNAAYADAAVTAASTTVRHWSSTFTSKGKKYSYSMVGTNPFTNPGSSSTVNTELQPITFKFANGVTISATAAATAIANSPIFVNTKFPNGTGQYGDMFQRANFAQPIGGRAYHVRLGLPSVRPAIVVNVPKASGQTQKTTSGVTYGLVNLNFITSTISGLVKSGNYNPATLPVFVAGNVFEYQQMVAICCVLGYHEALSANSGSINTFIFTSYPSPGIFGGGFADVAVLSHEVAEWIDDPFGTNFVEPWGMPQAPQTCFSNVLEVGDAIEGYSNAAFTVSLNGKTYHVQDEAFFSWFARQSPSIGLGGRYSWHAPAKLTKPAASCS